MIRGEALLAAADAHFEMSGFGPHQYRGDDKDIMRKW